VQIGFEAEHAGLREGDRITSWFRGDVSGEIQSPFDLTVLEIDQAPRGAIGLQGFRGGEKSTWTLGDNSWRLRTRPDLPAGLLNNYFQGEDLRRAGKPIDAVAIWRALAQRPETKAPDWVAAWIMSEAAESLAAPAQSAEADKAYQEALGFVRTAFVRALVFRAWAMQCERRGDLDKAAEHFQQSLQEGEKEGNRSLLVADDLNSLGRIAGRRGDLTSAERYFLQALDLRKKLAPESLVVAGTLSNLGLVARNHGDLVRAEEYLRDSLAIRERLAPNTLDAALVLNNLGLVADDKGELEVAESYYLQVLEIRRRLNQGSLEVAGALSNLGNTATNLGDLENSARYQIEALEIRERLAPNSLEAAESYNNLGILAEDRGDLAAAEEYHLHALEIRNKLAPHSLELAASLTNLGDVAWMRHELLPAQDYHNRALVIKEKLAPDSVNLARSLTSMALLAEEQGHVATAGRFLQHALAINRIRAPKGLALVRNLNQLASLALEQNRPTRAKAYLEEALKLLQEVAPAGLDIAHTWSLFGALARDGADLPAAETWYRRALQIHEDLVPGTIRHAESLASLAGIMAGKHSSESAQMYEKAIHALENQTALLGGAEDVRSGFRARYAGYYSDYITLLMTEKQPELALQVFERSRGRTLMEMLREAHLDIRKGIDPLLLDKERALRQELVAGVNGQLLILNGTRAQSNGPERKQRIERLLAEYHQVEGQIRASSPAYAALTQPPSLTVPEIQQQLLDDDTVLLEYALGEPRSYVWVVTSTLFESHILPSRSRIEAAAMRLYKKMASRMSDTNLTAPDTGVDQAAALLSRLALAPVSRRIRGKRLLIVSDGALQYVPFAVLPASEHSAPLVTGHEIVNAPSASVLALLRQTNTSRQPAPKMVAVLADPVFDAQDPRVAYANAHNAKPGGEVRLSTVKVNLAENHVARSASDAGWVHLARLPFSQREAAAILKVTPEGQGMSALGFRASRATAMSGELAEYRVVHFATHGLLNEEHPEFSGLALSLIDEQARPQNGFLLLQDIYNLNLPADLVVLSACETALGRNVRSEGLVGLTRGFMYAGATRVLASLWNADDVATQELMARFYKAMMKDSLPPAAALRRAQLGMLKQPRWRSPYYWAAFQIQGVWR
jgi:CHAT domain-containing protein/tetratricopeptide (TPR) repeat protein